MSKNYEEILDYIQSLTIIDTHEHLPGNESDLATDEYAEHGYDIFHNYLLHYFSSDLISAGLSKKEQAIVYDIKRPIVDRWDIVEPYWNACRYTGYGRSLDIIAKDIYGFDRINRQTIEPLNAAFMESYGKGQYERILKEKCKIEISLLDSDLNCDKRYFKSVFRLEEYYNPTSWDDIEHVKEKHSMPISCLDDWLQACTLEIESAIRGGAIAYKNAMSYSRTLAVGHGVYHDAEKEFNEFIKAIRIPRWLPKNINAPKAFQDYMLHHIFKELNQRRLPVQVHTGLHEGNGNILSDSNPMLLTPIFLQYQDIPFDIFHIGYPYQNELAALGKMFANVNIDMCWAHVISPFAAVSALNEFLDAVPYNKINGFGGDYMFVDGVYGHLKIAQQNISEVLTSKVEKGLYCVDEAKAVAKAILYDNPKRIFNL
ncbi:MAG: amidohydrolase family protein [Defluviitaleaceae bacterium]|nr:amidohydrolase family protein [Defluviitaleaceae bacterium]